jgi:hypothetical protein
MADKGWSREFEDPIPLPGGRKLITLRDAADYMTALPKKEAATNKGKIDCTCAA